MTATIHHLPRRNDSALRQIIARQKLMLALIDAATTAFAIAEEMRQRDEERRANIAWLEHEGEP